MKAGKVMLGSRSCCNWVAAKIPAPNRPTTASTTTAPSLRESRVMRYMAGSGLPFGFIQVLDQEEAEMPKLGKLVRGQPSGAFGLPLASVSLNGLHPHQARLRQVGANGSAVRGIRNSAHEPVPLELVDQSRDGARDQVLRLRQLAELQLVARTEVETGE